MFSRGIEKACNFIKKRLQHSCFPVNIAKFLRVPFLQNTSTYQVNTQRRTPNPAKHLKCSFLQKKLTAISRLSQKVTFQIFNNVEKCFRRFQKFHKETNDKVDFKENSGIYRANTVNVILEKQCVFQIHSYSVEIYDYLGKFLCTKSTFIVYNFWNILLLAKFNFGISGPFLVVKLQ